MRYNNGLHQTGRGGAAVSLCRRPVVEARPAGEPGCSTDATYSQQSGLICFLSLAAALFASACASAPYAVGHAESGYPRPDSAQCNSGPGEEAVEILVHDSLGQAFPGAAVYVARLRTMRDETAPPAWSALTAEDGRAMIRVHGKGVFAITGTLMGFLGGARTVEVGEGCVAKVNLLFRVATKEGS